MKNFIINFFKSSSNRIGMLFSFVPAFVIGLGLILNHAEHIVATALTFMIGMAFGFLFMALDNGSDNKGNPACIAIGSLVATLIIALI